MPLTDFFAKRDSLFAPIIIRIMLQRVYCVHCPHPKCGDTIVLPRQSPLGTFEYPHCQPTGEWPIDYLCIYCAQVFSFPVEAIHLEGVEALDQSLPYLWRYVFSSDDMHSVRKYWIYAKSLRPKSEEELIEGILKPTGKWKPEHGKPRLVGYDPYPLR